MRAAEIREGDELVSDEGRKFWTAVTDAGAPIGADVHLLVEHPDGTRQHRWLPADRELVIRRKGVIVETPTG